MNRRLIALVLWMCLLALPAVALQWEEIGASATAVPHPNSKLPSVIFNVGLAYDGAPDWMQLRISWSVFEVVGDQQIPLYEYTKTTMRRSGTDHIYSASEHVLIEPGKQYGAHVSIEDLENGLSYARSVSYFAPVSFSVGLRLIGYDGSEEADVTGLTVDELDQLVQLQHDLTAYEVLAKDVSIQSLFSGVATADTDYPVAVVIMPELGYDGNWGTDDKPITVTFGLSVLAFKVQNLGDGAGILDQLARYDQEFNGTAYAGSEGSGVGKGNVVFVQDSVAVILDAAVEELASRSR